MIGSINLQQSQEREEERRKKESETEALSRREVKSCTGQQAKFEGSLEANIFRFQSEVWAE